MLENILQLGALNKGSASPRGAQLNAVAAFAVRTEVAGAAGTDQTSVWLENRYLRTGEVQRSAQRPGIGPGTEPRPCHSKTPSGYRTLGCFPTRAALDYRATAVSTGPFPSSTS